MSTSESQESRWKAEITRRLEQGDDLEFSIAQFAQAVGVLASDQALIAFLDGLVTSTTARKIEAYRCPVTLCSKVLPAGTITSCPYCHTDYQQEGEEIVVEYFYRLEGETSREIRWVIVIHGMNSRAPWQEEFSWQIANRLRYSAPVLIYKYGWATVDVLVSPFHRRLARQLGERIRIAIEQATESQRPPRPDIIAHSFGTRLFSLILEDSSFDDLKFGRIITAGSVVRPDFDWGRQIAAGRVEAVLNHVGAKDKAVPLAQYTIPGAGPGGTVGYAAKTVLNVRNADFGHSDFFVPENLRVLISNDGLWHSFLTHPLARFRPDGVFELDRGWKPASLLLRVLARTLGYTIFCFVGPFTWLRRKLDP
ncbi:hypothetical protein [Pseudomonas veronii]|uniref:hypothetical protein n=1 Tax=Pseudomonas veronii TaxID=76761 RepID=UPI000625A63D|nr:hypothetical protein [Pseudomonas veronii]